MAYQQLQEASTNDIAELKQTLEVERQVKEVISCDSRKKWAI